MPTIFAALAFLFATSAYAGQINIRSGSLDFDELMTGDGPVTVRGRGFTFDGWAQNAMLEAADCAYMCDRGETVSIGMRVSGNDLGGVATMGNESYNDVGGFSTYDSFDVVITGHGYVPRIAPVTVVTRVIRGSFDGVFFHGDLYPYTVTAETMHAPCAATLRWQPFGEGWYLDSIDYDLLRR